MVYRHFELSLQRKCWAESMPESYLRRVTSNHNPVTAMCHVLEHSNNLICIQCKDGKLWVLKYSFACMWICVVMHTCVYIQTHTNIFFSDHAFCGHQPGQNVSPDYKGGHAALTASVQPLIHEANLMLFSFLAVIVFSVRILCDLFNFSKCVHIGHGTVFLKEPMG